MLDIDSYIVKGDSNYNLYIIFNGKDPILDRKTYSSKSSANNFYKTLLQDLEAMRSVDKASDEIILQQIIAALK